MKIGFFELEPGEKELLIKFFPRDQLFFQSEKLTPQNAAKFSSLEVVSVFIYSQLNEKALQKLPHLKLITTRSMGFDHIDLAACKKRTITVCNVPSYGENTVAEQAFALILALSRKIYASVERTKQTNFESEGLRGFDLKGKTLGVLGTGNIGRHVVKIAHGLEMKILAYDVFPDKKFSREMNFKYVSLKELLKNSDVVTVHVPLNKHTFHLIDKEKISWMKKTALLINTARGGIVETDALVRALQQKKLGGAGLDVLEEECDIREEAHLARKGFPPSCDMKVMLENHLLLKMPNVLITPHNAYNTVEAMRRIMQVTIENINNFKKGRKINVLKF